MPTWEHYRTQIEPDAFGEDRMELNNASIAISLKRIADALEAQSQVPKLEDEIDQLLEQLDRE